MPAIVVCVLLGFTPSEHAKVDRVDLVEINHFFDEQGRLVFDQLIFYDWCAVENRYNVRDWRLLKSPAQIPVRNWRDRDYVAIWHDFKERDVLRKVVAKMIRETWTQYDPELLEREFLPQEKRRELSKPLAIMRKARINPRANGRANGRANPRANAGGNPVVNGRPNPGANARPPRQPPMPAAGQPQANPAAP